MYLRTRMETEFREMHFRGRSALHKIGEFAFLITLSNLTVWPKFNFGS